MSTHAITQCSPSCFQQLKPVEKWLLVSTLITSLVLVILAATVKMPIPTSALYGMSGSGFSLSFTYTLFVAYCRQKAQKSSSDGREPALAKSNEEVASKSKAPKPAVKVPQKTPDQLVNEAYNLIEALAPADRIVSLKGDFDLVSELEPDPGKVVSQLTAMLEALPFYLSQDQNPQVSPFLATGVSNYHGNNCHFNAGLQTLVHTRCADYLLLRPQRAPEGIGDPPTPVEKPPEEVDPPNWDLYSYATQEERLEVSRNYDRQKEELEQKKQAYKEYQAALREHGYAVQRHAYHHNVYEKQCIAKPALYRLIVNLRQEVKVSKADIEAIFKLMSYQPGAQGSVGTLLGKVSAFTKGYRFYVKGCNLEDIERGDLEAYSLPIIILGSGNHYKVYVRLATGNFSINDGSVTPLSSSWDAVLERVKQERSTWQPYLVYSEFG